MKKIYISPVVQVITIISESKLMVGSNLDLNNDSADQGYGMDSKSSGDWDIWSSDDSDY